MHSLRRRSALRRLRRLGRVQAVVFVCHGNICRSPYAAEAFRARVTPSPDGTPQVRSGGFIGPGRPSPTTAVSVARRRGVRLAGHRSRLVRDTITKGDDLVVVMNARQARDIRYGFAVPGDRILILGDLDPGPVTSREILDPLDGSESVFDSVYARIDACLDQLIPTLQRGGERTANG